MNITETINRLTEIKERFGNLKIVGGYLTDDSGLDDILVVDSDGHEIYPENHGNKSYIEGVFLT